MNGHDFTFADTTLTALGSGALYWRAQELICVSDLHLGKSERRARLGDATLPPYETQDTLSRIEADLHRSGAKTVICLGDSFDDAAAVNAMPEQTKIWITQLQAGRRWIWIEGNHDPGPINLGGTHLAEFKIDNLAFRHIADPHQKNEISGHYHPKVTLATKSRSITRRAFLIDACRVILPAFGTYTGGLRSNHAALQSLMRLDALAVMTGPTPRPVPMPR